MRFLQAYLPRVMLTSHIFWRKIYMMQKMHAAALK